TFGISSLLKKQFKTLSGGQKQLAMAARSIISKPRLLILDEPMAGVDIEHSGTYLEKLKSLNLTGTAIIMVTHELDIIQKEASKVLWLNKKVIFFGVKDEFLRLAHETHIDQHPHD
ncbi:MAG TPA: ATP-binding cassette domain-containing protein, partial [Patescibacteria group bacterium]|nr:ATP-binding cassette domain-containing protein [Patescibacteria group bacterium]